ncbi:hypothetical protein FOVSG1_013375 [Fusarium oxysporum f. sp. vasinfectum]
MSGNTGHKSISLPMAMATAGFFAIAMYNTVEILVLIFSTFKRRRGLYFWSMLIADVGIPGHAIAVVLRFFALAPNLPMVVVNVICRWAMVTGQSVVLYSRLHLVVRDPRKVRWILIMIVTTFFILQIPVSVLFLASNSGHPEPFINVFNLYGKIYLAGFILQESIISGLYIYEAVPSLKPMAAIKGAEGQKMIRHLVVMFIMVILLDGSLMVTEYANNFPPQITYKPFVYSVKLKIEFIILNKLLAFTRISACKGLSHCPDSTCVGSYRQSCAKDIVPTKNTDMVSRHAGRNDSNMEIRAMEETTDHIYDGRSYPTTTPSVLPRVESGVATLSQIGHHDQCEITMSGATA